MNRKAWKSMVLAAACVGLTYPAYSEESEAIKAARLVEDAFCEVVDQTKPAVVVISNKQSAPPMMGDENMLPPDFFDFFGIPRQRFERRERRERWGGPMRRRQPQKALPVGKGSGVIIREDGYIVTNYHVIKDNEYLEVKTEDGKVYDNEKDKDAVVVVGVDTETDLAVLRIGNGQKTDFPALKFANSEKVRVGQWVIAIGAPFNLDYSVTIGCVSQMGRYDMGMSTLDNYIQTDASINPGNSGGPLVNIKGEIVGINQFIMTGGASRGSIGLGFSIASNLVKQVTDNLIQDGEVARPFLGISMQELDENLRSQFEADYGVVVSSVLPGEAAERAGVNAGDIIQKINGVKVQSPHALLLAVTSYRPGDKIKLTLLRSGKEMEFELIAGKRGVDGWTADGSREPRDANASESSPEQLGLKLTEEDGKIVVEEVFPDGAAARVGGGDVNLQPGDIIHEINRQPVRSLGDVRKALKQTNKNKVMLWVERKYRNRSNSFRFYIVIPLD